MNIVLSNDLINIENEIELEYKNNNKLTGMIKTEIDSCPSHDELSQLKRNIKKNLTTNKLYVDNVRIEYWKYSRDHDFNKKHEWDLVAILLSFGLITPILIPKLITDLYKYYTTSDYNYVLYEIETRQSQVTEIID